MSAALPGQAALVARCRQGETEAFTPLVRHYQNAAYAVALGYVRDIHEAEDVVQDAFIAAYCKLGQLREPEKFGGWLRGIVVMRCKEWLRHRQVVQAGITSLRRERKPSAGAEQTERMAKKDLWEEVDKLPVNYRTAALLHYLSGLSYEEIAGFLDLPVSTVKGRLQQARIRLREALSAIELEGIEMSKVDISEEVQDIVYRIVTEPIEQTVSLEGMQNIALYCGIGTDIEIRQADGEEVVLEGTKATIGLSAKDARENLAKIQILTDQVEDLLTSGPHEGVIFNGTSQNEKGELTGMSRTTGEDWKERVEPALRTWDWEVERYPHLKDQVNSLPEGIKKGLRQATRISVVCREMVDIVMPRQAYTPRLQEVFKANYIGKERVHGPVGSVSLAIGVPRGKTVTIVGGRSVGVSGLCASVNLIGVDEVELDDVEGEVHLFDCPLARARDIRGKLWQRYYRYGGTYFSHQSTTGIRRVDQESRIEDVVGEVDIEVGRVELELVDIAGRVHVDNYYGRTRLSQNRFDEGNRFKLVSRSGEISLFLKRDLIEQVNVTVNTLCGAVKCEALKKLISRSYTTHSICCLSTMNSPQDSSLVEADFYIQTESGDVVIEGVK